MRRADQEVRDRDAISQIIRKCQVCRLGLAIENTPYLLPVSFGYDGHAIYFHTAKEGRKLDFLTAGNPVCFEFEHGVRILPHDTNPCNWTFSFQSIIGYGTVSELVTHAEKQDGLQVIMRQYSGREWEFRREDVEAVKVWKLEIESMTGKQSKDH